MANIERIPVLSNPQLIDRVIIEIQKGLAARLGWLNHAFGRAQRLVKEINGRGYHSPGVYAGTEEYLEVSPCESIGNFSFFNIDDPQTIEWIPNQRGAIDVDFSLIFWFNLDKIPGAENRNTEFVKAEILKALNGGIMLRNGRIRISRIYEEADNIYRGYDLKEVDNQFLMHPFAGFRFYGELHVNENC